MAEQKIDLRRVRDFSENISDTFLFIKQHFKSLLYSFVAIAGIFMLSTAIAGGLYQSQFGEIFKDILSGSKRQLETMQVYGVRYFILIGLSILNLVAMQVVVAAYMKLYAQNGQAPTVEVVWGEFRKYYLKVVVLSLPVYLLILIGMVFCLLPGFYLGVVLMPFQVILVMEDKSMSAAFNRCFSIIKNNFWTSFGIYVVVYIIYAVGAMFISSIAAVISGLLSYLTTKDISSTIGVATSILNIFSYIFYVIFFVSIVLHYFTLVEQFDGTGIINRLEKLGNDHPDFGNIQEQY